MRVMFFSHVDPFLGLDFAAGRFQALLRNGFDYSSVHTLQLHPLSFS